MADTTDLGSVALRMGVRVPPGAPFEDPEIYEPPHS